MAEEIAYTSVVLVLAAIGLALALRRHNRDEGSLLIYGFVAHIASVFAQVFIIRDVYGGGDLDAYYRSGVETANALRLDFSFIAPELVKVFFHVDDVHLPFQILGGPNATGSLTVVAAGLFYVLGDSLYASSMVVALWAFFGKLAIFYAVCGEFEDPKLRRRLLIATLLIPSVVFWSATIAKEAVVIGFLGFALWIFKDQLRGEKSVAKIAMALACLAPVAMIKPYILIGLFAAAGVWLYWDRGGNKRFIAIRPAQLVLATVIALAGMAVVGRLSPQLSVDNLGKSTATIQASGTRVEGGSNYQLTEAAPADTSLGRQLALAPLALPTALFRPFLIEVRNPMMLMNAVETTFLLVLVGRLLLRANFEWIRERIMGSGTLMFCLTITILLGTAVGLTSTNMGSLSRYRMPFMPFFVGMVLVLDFWLHTIPVKKKVDRKLHPFAVKP